MFAHADNNNMLSLSKLYEQTKIADLMVHFQQFELRRANFKKFSGGACPQTPLQCFCAFGTRNTGHLCLGCNQASHSLET